MNKPISHISGQDPTTQAHEVIDRLYDVAIDPLRYEELLDHWEMMMRPFRRESGKLSPLALGAVDFEAHFNRASAVLDSLDASSSRESSVAALDHISNAAAFVCAANQRFGTVNPAARCAFGIRLGAPLTDMPFSPEDVEAFVAQVGQLLRSNSEAPVTLRMRSLSQGRIVVLHLRVMRPEGQPAYVVGVTSELIWPDGFSDILKTVFNLTEAEAEVLRALSECHSLKEIAEMRGRSIETIRAQIKSLQSKTETRSQSELVRMCLSMMDVAAFSSESTTDGPDISVGYQNLEPLPFHHIMRVDGRRLDYLILGDPEGTPCLFSSSVLGFVRWPAAAEAEAKRRGLKVIVPVRPGYGNSTSLPRGADALSEHLGDLVALMDHFAIVSCPMITMASDFHFAAQMHMRFEGRITCVIACCGVLPLSRPDQYERMNKWHRFIFAGALYTPLLLPFMVRAGFALVSKLGKEGMLKAVYALSDADMAAISDPDIAEALVCGSDVTHSDSHCAHKALAAEIILSEGTDWRAAVDAMEGTLPVYFLNGTQDPQIPAETLKEFQVDHPWIDFRIYPDSGQFVFFKHWKDVLDIIDENHANVRN